MKACEITMNVFHVINRFIATVGFLGCFLVTYALMFFLNQAHICSIYYQRGSPKLRVAIYLCLFMFLYFCSLCIECYNSLSKEKIDKKKKKEQGSIKIEV
ncbi:conserved Plasmodium membrane protein, unknown function [Plasmodium ovale curtisi]|uniref:Uncharacterized protein n=1 Tax=Plasmodium ovale curtisi TaxID=864141 RepID=A0A1A8VZD7_PLAOA|nr:conserved Plasmodium membrane protein, unknown function [Plasmodium ovale curtisi]SBS92447.1 conserved Plasmodium membrane protein, unknown function [Plasmodium ovale curtisi]